VALPTVGALVEGWILVVPKSPALSFAEISTPQFDELEAFLGDIIPLLQESYGPVAIFEHGPSRHGSAVGCGVDYAHLHLVPTDVDLHKGAHRLAPDLNWEPVDALRDIQRYYASKMGYWFVQQLFGSGPCFIGQSVYGIPPDQLFRRVIASGIGHAAAYDWKLDLGAAKISATINKLTRHPSPA
jgi:ATP adenylyltransferase